MMTNVASAERAIKLLDSGWGIYSKLSRLYHESGAPKEKPTEKRVNSVPISVEFNFTKKLEGRALKAGEFTFELKDGDGFIFFPIWIPNLSV